MLSLSLRSLAALSVVALGLLLLRPTPNPIPTHRDSAIASPTTTTMTTITPEAPPDPAGAALAPETLEFAHSMFDAARNGDADLLLQAVDAGLPPNLTNEKGNTLLMLAAYAGHAPLVAALLARGADPDRLNDRAQSPLAGAVFKREDAVVRALLAAGADPRRGTPSALESARVFGRPDLLELFGVKEGEAAGPEAEAAG